MCHKETKAQRRELFFRSNFFWKKLDRKLEKGNSLRRSYRKKKQLRTKENQKLEATKLKSQDSF